MLEKIWKDNLKATNLEEENLFFFFKGVNLEVC